MRKSWQWRISRFPGAARLGIVALTGAAFVGLRFGGLLGNLSLPLLLGILLAGGVASEVAFRVASSRGGFGVLIVIPMIMVTVVIYIIGWGPALAIGYLFPLSESLKLKNPPPWPIAYAAAVGGLAGGELAIATGLVHSYIPTPYVHALAILAMLGLAFVVRLFASMDSARQAATDALKDRETTFRLMFANNPQPMWVYAEDSLGILAVNEAAVSAYGYSRERWLAMRITDIRPPEDVPTLMDQLSDDRSALEKSGTWRHRLADGSIIDVEVTSHRLPYLGRDAVLVTGSDVTKRNALEERLRYQAFHDELTGLANRRLLRDQIAAAQQEPQAGGSVVALLVVDLDNFHELNEALGPEAGDAVLRQVAHSLTTMVGPGGGVARIGSDEFALVLHLHGQDAVAQLGTMADEVLVHLNRPLMLGSAVISVEASIGGIIGRSSASGERELLPAAQTALQRAKGSLGRVQIEDLRTASAPQQRLAVVAELRHAIDHGDLLLHFQPKLALASGRVVGMEALVRWQHPRRGLLFPDSFIPLAGRTGLIRPLTSFVLGEAVRRLKAWRAAGYELSMAVNLAAANLTDLELPTEISALLTMSGLPPSALVLEITEGAVMTDSERTDAVVQELSGAGIELSIDDFGTAHSSLARLRTLPITELKLDKAF
ncbi:MAG: putative bifunctional diguanylate cyclase/phosphodiesterase, partial [Acidimicrobiales bacterium]